MNRLTVSAYAATDRDLAYLSIDPLVYLVAYLINVIICVHGSIEMLEKL